MLSEVLPVFECAGIYQRNSIPTGVLSEKAYPEHHDRTVEEEVYMEILYKLHLFPQIPRLIFLHLWCTGLRISEVCTLKGDAYYWDGEDAWLKVYQIKMKADKMIPIPLVLYKVMRKYIEKNHIRPQDYIFKGKMAEHTGEGHSGRNFNSTASGTRLQMENIFLKAMITGIRWLPGFMMTVFPYRRFGTISDTFQRI